jgi:hypothetical protein
MTAFNTVAAAHRDALAIARAHQTNNPGAARHIQHQMTCAERARTLDAACSLLANLIERQAHILGYTPDQGFDTILHAIDMCTPPEKPIR